MDRKTLQNYRVWKRELVELSAAIRVGGTADSARREKMERHVLLRQLCREADEFVSAIPDPMTRRMFRLMYLEGSQKLTFRQAAQKIGGGNSEEGVRKRIVRYLNTH